MLSSIVSPSPPGNSEIQNLANQGMQNPGAQDSQTQNLLISLRETLVKQHKNPLSYFNLIPCDILNVLLSHITTPSGRINLETRYNIQKNVSISDLVKISNKIPFTRWNALISMTMYILTFLLWKYNPYENDFSKKYGIYIYVTTLIFTELFNYRNTYFFKNKSIAYVDRSDLCITNLGHILRCNHITNDVEIYDDNMNLLDSLLLTVKKPLFGKESSLKFVKIAVNARGNWLLMSKALNKILVYDVNLGISFNAKLINSIDYPGKCDTFNINPVTNDIYLSDDNTFYRLSQSGRMLETIDFNESDRLVDFTFNSSGYLIAVTGKEIIIFDQKFCVLNRVGMTKTIQGVSVDGNDNIIVSYHGSYGRAIKVFNKEGMFLKKLLRSTRASKNKFLINHRGNIVWKGYGSATIWTSAEIRDPFYISN